MLQFSHFELVLVVLTDGLGLKFDELTELGRTSWLCQRIRQEQKILVVLDDMWGKLDLTKVGVAFDEDYKEPKAKDPIVEPAISNYFNHNTINDVVSDGFKSRETIQEKSQYIGANDIAFAPVVKENVETSPREKSTENIEIGETCSFMRSAASMKEWAKAKAAAGYCSFSARR
ncbi:hypothetical protein ACSQ67_019967 [Phaseolus vulgaris]